ncbi:MAG: hypothetical protein ACYDG6_14520 [Thermincolia bacterium]
MDLLKPIRKAVEKIKDVVEQKKLDNEDLQELEKWKKKLEAAKTNWDTTLMDEREMIYNGTHDVDANINDSSTKARKKANNVQNITYEFVESQIDPTILQPSVKSKRPGNEYLAKMIEDSAKNDLQEIDIERINDETERTTPIQGWSMIKVHWNPDFKHHLHRGEIELSNPHPKALIPQPGVYNIQKMDHFFLLSSQTKSYVKQRYGVELGKTDNEQYPEINQFHDGQSTTTGNDNVTVIEVFYRDDDADIGKFVWCNETPLENMPKFFHRRLERCTKCGAVKGMEEECQAVIEEGFETVEDYIEPVVCGNRKYKLTVEEYETLEEPIELQSGVIIPAGTKIPYFTPTRYPIIIRRNVPVAFQLGGQSDVDIIRDQADAIKKIISRIEEKIIRGSVIIKALKDHKFKLSNALYEIIRGSQSELQALGTISLTDDVVKELQVVQHMYKSAQDTLGITNSWQGKEDQTAQSGVAKQIQVQQAGGRLQSKRFNKYAAYKELFEIMFEFKLAYYDELRPFLAKGPMGKEEHGEFNKYEFLVQDEAGEWYYNTDFLFAANAGEGLPRDKMWIEQKAQELFTSKAIDNVGLWTILESVDFPMAKDMKEMAIKQQQIQQQIQQQMMMQQAQQSMMPRQAMNQGEGVQV